MGCEMKKLPVIGRAAITYLSKTLDKERKRNNRSAKLFTVVSPMM